MRNLPVPSAWPCSRLEARCAKLSCGCNEVSVLIPCHRVVAADRRLTGFRWGVHRKRALLAREASLEPERLVKCKLRPGRLQSHP
ncbi:MAG: hypothetical protein CSA62_01655 [Planctomycetota bacterium]|nr:MAG: hypothetical protein CSA62_01655 [Planctomycetota bacterium]